MSSDLPINGPDLLVCETAGWTLRQRLGPIYVLEADEYIGVKIMSEALDEVWAHDSWRMPWGLLVRFGPDTRYDLALRSQHLVPPPEKRAVATLVVTENALYRMSVNAIGVGLRMATGGGVILEAREDFEGSIRELWDRIQQARDDEWNSAG